MSEWDSCGERNVVRTVRCAKFSGGAARRERNTVLGSDALGPNPAACVLRRRVEDLELGREVLVELEDGGHVAAAVAIVGRGPHRHEAVVEHELVALHDELVRAADEAEAVAVVELLHNVRAKEVARAALAKAGA